MSRPKGSKNRGVNAVKNVLQKVNARIKAIEKKFGLNNTESKALRDTLKKLVPDSSYLAKSGLLKVNATYEEEALQVLVNNVPGTVKQIKEGAMKSLASDDLTDFIGPMPNMEERIKKEVKAKYAYEASTEDLNPYESEPGDWKAVQDSFNKNMEAWLNDIDLFNEFMRINDMLASIDNSTSYTTAMTWMDDAADLIARASERGLL